MTALSAGRSLDELAGDLRRFGAVVRGDGAVRVRDVQQDSRRASAGDLFAARTSDRERLDAHVHEAIGRGASAILAVPGSVGPSVGVPVVEVDDVRLALGFAAEAVHGHPSRSLEVIGVTGTNGKTTVTWLAEQVLERMGARPARLGTLGYSLGQDRTTSPLTTPEADEVTRWMARARDGGATHFAMEVSSHALVQARVEAIAFRAAIFTNLTQDHLDFHGDMETYGRAKRRLFVDLSPALAIVNVDDPFGARLAGEAAGRVLRVARSDGEGRPDVYAESFALDARGLRARVRSPTTQVDVDTPLAGVHNLDNALALLALVEALGLDVEAAARALGSVTGAPGRLERCDGPSDDVLVLVDYAHTPDALSRALDACRRMTERRVLCVFGCGGDRDPDKRPKMGRAVARGADRAIVTNDNPRSEDPAAIVRAIEAGLRDGGADYEIVLDRAAAIDLAVNEAERGDVVLIAGKGHEPYQILGSRRVDFDDRVAARRALLARRGRAG